jgi:Nickel responsive protein SCO4226-like
MSHSSDSRLTDVFVERTAEVRVKGYDIAPAARHSSACLDLYRVEWLETLICVGGTRLVCHFRAPDAESVRLALRNEGIPFDTLWAGTALDSGDSGASDTVIEHVFETPVPTDAAEALRTVTRKYLAPQCFKLNRAFISRDRTRIICLCEARGDVASHHRGVWRFLRRAAHA